MPRMLLYPGVTLSTELAEECTPFNTSYSCAGPIGILKTTQGSQLVLRLKGRGDAWRCTTFPQNTAFDLCKNRVQAVTSATWRAVSSQRKRSLASQAGQAQSIPKVKHRNPRTREKPVSPQQLKVLWSTSHIQKWFIGAINSWAIYPLMFGSQFPLESYALWKLWQIIC